MWLLNIGVCYYEASALIVVLAYNVFLFFLDKGYFPIGTMKGFSDRFAEKFIEYNGTLLLSTNVGKIKVKNDQSKRFI